MLNIRALGPYILKPMSLGSRNKTPIKRNRKTYDALNNCFVSHVAQGIGAALRQAFEVAAHRNCTADQLVVVQFVLIEIQTRCKIVQVSRERAGIAQPAVSDFGHPRRRDWPQIAHREGGEGGWGIAQNPRGMDDIVVCVLSRQQNHAREEAYEKSYHEGEPKGANSLVRGSNNARYSSNCCCFAKSQKFILIGWRIFVPLITHNDLAS